MLLPLFLDTAQVYESVDDDLPPSFPLRDQYVPNKRAAREAAEVGSSHDGDSGDDISEAPKKTTKGDRRTAKKKTAPKNPKGSRKRGPWNYNETRMEFLTDLKKSGLTFTEAKKEWDNSDKKRELLSTLSLPELKRRKFVPKSCKTHPWA